MPDLIPGLPAPQGGLPPGLPSPGGPPPPGLMAAMGQPKPNIGAVPAPSANPGNVHAAMAKIASAAGIIQEALPQIPLGSELHTKVLKITQELSKLAQESGVSPANAQQSLVQSARQGAQAQPMQAIQRMFGAAPPGAPAMPSPGGPPGMGGSEAPPMAA